MTLWYVIHEYETYDKDEPFHTWLVCGTYENKAKAELECLNLSFDEYCRNKPKRWLPADQKKVKDQDGLKTEEKVRIVRQVISNIGERSSSRNQYWGIGFYIISNEKLKINKNIVNINDIHKSIRDPEPVKKEAKEPVKKNIKVKSDNESDMSGSDSYDSYDESEDDYDFSTDENTENEKEKQEEEDFSENEKKEGKVSDGDKEEEASNTEPDDHDDRQDRQDRQDNEEKSDTEPEEEENQEENTNKVVDETDVEAYESE